MLVEIEAERTCETMKEFENSTDDWAEDIADYAMLSVAGFKDRRKIGRSLESDCAYAASILREVLGKALRVIEEEYLCKDSHYSLAA